MSVSTRLYDLFVPSHYDIVLDINRSNKTIAGRVRIKGEAKDANFKLNQKYLTVTRVLVDGAEVPFEASDQSETLAVAAGKTGELTLEISYSAKLTDSLMGIYPSYYVHDGVKKQLVSTQFETTFARQAFPCVDEPLAKATFSLGIKFDEKPSEIVISNQPEERVEDGVHYFKETVRMSTYLLAFALGEFQAKYATTPSGVKIGSFCTKAHAAKELDFALDIATRCIDFYERYYQTPYPLEHSYQVALPDFSAGAMENWGMVTYREAYMLLDPDNSSLSNKQRVATVIAHELAHQWFGDLVTMKWWDNLWLNESFANMMEYVAIDAIEPDWHIWEVFQTSDTPMALGRDATDGVQSVHVMVEDPAEIDAIFDSAIVYAKGARMLVMVRALLGDDNMRRGLKAYFDTHKYGNAEGSDLWAALEQASGLNVGTIMDSWLEQPGYPVVEACLAENTLKLSQQQFFIGEHAEKNRLWQIPLAPTSDKIPSLMTTKTLEIDNYQAIRDEQGLPIRLNQGNNSHFIVHYDETLLSDILEHLDRLDSIDQLQLLQDMSLLAKAHYISYAEIIPLIERLAGSTSHIVQTKLWEIVDTLDMFVDPDSREEGLLKVLADRISVSNVERLGFAPRDGESIDDKLARPICIALSLYAENKRTIAELHRIYEQHKDDIVSLDADLRGLVLKCEVKHFGNSELFSGLIDAYQHNSDALFKNDARAAVCATRDVAQIHEILKNFKCADVIKPQDLRMWFAPVLGNPTGEEIAWTWLRDDWKWLEATVGGDMEFTTFIEVCGHAFHTEKRLEEFRAFFMPKREVAGLGREIEMDAKLIHSKCELIAAQKGDVYKALEKAVALDA